MNLKRQIKEQITLSKNMKQVKILAMMQRVVYSMPNVLQVGDQLPLKLQPKNTLSKIFNNVTNELGSNNAMNQGWNKKLSDMFRTIA